MCDLRHRARNLAATLGFDRDRSIDLETAVGEAAMNAVVHAVHGRAGFVPTARTHPGMDQRRRTGIALDRLPNATLTRGYSTASRWTWLQADYWISTVSIC